MATTVTNIIDLTAQDVRALLDTTADATLMIDYTNRVHLQVLRAARWPFELSTPQRFITQLEKTDYWLGTAAGNTNNQADTGLAISDLGEIKSDTVRDLSNHRELKRIYKSPLGVGLSFDDGTSRPREPLQYLYAPDATADVIQLFPAANNQNAYKPEPHAPIVESSTSGALSERTYYVKVAWVDTLDGVSTPSEPARKVTVAASDVLVVKASIPIVTTNAENVSYDRFNVYASETLGSETKQGSTLSTGGDFTEPDTGLTSSGDTVATSNGLAELRGYIIEFQYYKTRTLLTTAGATLQTPDRYRDVIAAGVNWLSFDYLERPARSEHWLGIYLQGIKGIQRDRNIERSDDYIQVDPVARRSSEYFFDNQW